MAKDTFLAKKQLMDVVQRSEDEREEMLELGVLGENGSIKPYIYPKIHDERPPVEKRTVQAPDVLNEAYNYARPSSFSRALSLNLNGYKVLLISGTASVDENGETIHIGDFRAQCWRTYRNITNLLKAEDMTWHDIVRTSCYLRDIDRDYKDFNEIRSTFFDWLNLDPLPASTGIQARICRENLLVEIEAIAICSTS